MFGTCHLILVFSVQVGYLLDSGALVSTRPLSWVSFAPSFYSFECLSLIVPYI